MTESRVAEIMALADAQFDAWWHDHGDAITDDVEGLCARAWSAAILAARARLESALREPVEMSECPCGIKPEVSFLCSAGTCSTCKGWGAIIAAAGGRK